MEFLLTSTSSLGALGAIGLVQTFTSGIVILVGRRGAALARSLPLLVSGAAGVLLATACLDLLPEALGAPGAGPAVWRTLLISLLALFCLDAVVFAVSAKTPGQAEPVAAASAATLPAAPDGLEHSSRHRTTTPLLFGSALHSAVDGVAIAAAFTAGPRAGWSAAIAVALHELPHRLSDFSLLLHRGIPRASALRWSVWAGLTALLGGVLVTAFGVPGSSAHLLLPISAATFLYIALVDLVPELQAHRDPEKMWWEVAALVAGAGVIAAAMHLGGE